MTAGSGDAVPAQRRVGGPALESHQARMTASSSARPARNEDQPGLARQLEVLGGGRLQ
jgi:hypothetical protein